MRLGVLESVAHNIADSLASGIGLMIGVYAIDVFGEASAAEPGYINVNFLNGELSGSPVSPHLKRAVKLYSSALSDLCQRSGIAREEFSELSARFGTDVVAGEHFTVRVCDTKGRTSEKTYVGSPGRRFGKGKRWYMRREA